MFSKLAPVSDQVSRFDPYFLCACVLKVFFVECIADGVRTVDGEGTFYNYTALLVAHEKYVKMILFVRKFFIGNLQGSSLLH